MSRLHTSGFEESLAQADLSLTTWDSSTGTITITAPPVTRGQSATCAQFTTAVEGHVTKSLTTAVATGKLYTRVYCMFGDFGGASATAGAIFRWINGAAVNGIVVRFTASTKTFRLENNASGSVVAANGSFVMTINRWVRLELEIILSSTTSGSATLNIYDGDSSTILETLSLTAQATAGTATIATLSGIEIGNRTGVDWGTVSLDDIAINNDDTSLGDGQNTWCGAGSIFLVKPAAINTQPVQWTSKVGAPGNDSSLPNLGRPGYTMSNGAAVAATIVTNQSNVDDEPGTPDDATTYNFTSDNVSVDRFSITPAPSALVDATAFTVIDVYARVGGTSTSAVTLCLSIWDDQGFLNDGPAVTINAAAFQRTKSGEHNASSLTGVTKAKLNAFSIGYKSLSGIGIERRVSALWANIEYAPSTALTVSNTAVSPYNSLASLTAVSQHNYEELLSLSSGVLTSSGSVSQDSSQPNMGRSGLTQPNGVSLLGTTVVSVVDRQCNYESSVQAIQTAQSAWEASGFAGISTTFIHVYESLVSASQSA